MKLRTALLAATWVIGVSGFGMGAANASTVLYDNAGFVQGQQSFSQTLNLSGPGVLTVTLSNISWPESLSSLNFVLSTAAGPIAPSMGAGTESFQVDGGRLFALWFGQAAEGPQDPQDLGLYGLKIVFQPYAPPPPVPLPATGFLLLAGLALLAWRLRRRDFVVEGPLVRDCNETLT
jgi:hypothetical protein